MPAANVRTYEKALVPRVGGEKGVYNAIVIPAKKGPINEPVLVTGENDLLNRFTPDGTIKVGYNTAYYSALAVLQQTNSLWVIRSANDALYGGVLINREGTTSVSHKQVDEISPKLDGITFDVSGIVDGSAEVTISNLVGGVPEDLVGRTINIFNVGQVTYDVLSVSGATLTLSTSIISSVSFSGTGVGTIAESIDFISFDADFGSGNSLTVEATNLQNTAGNAVINDLDGITLSFIADGVKFSRTVTSVAGTTLTLDSATPVVTNQIGTGFKGTPVITSSISGIVDGGTSVVVSNITPSYMTLVDFETKTLEIVADMNDSSTLVISSVVSNSSGSVIDFDSGINNPSLIDSSNGEAPAAEATANGFTDPAAIVQPYGDLVTFVPSDFYSVMSLYAINEGEWSKDVRVEILTKNQKTPGTFTINVYLKGNLVRPVESFVCSRDPEGRDGFNRNTFVDIVLQSSNYINGQSNSIIDKDILPIETVVRDINGNIMGDINSRAQSMIKMVAGDDGDAVTDTNMINSADLMNNKNNYPLSVFLDGGWTSASYQRRLAQICEQRDDSFAILSVPFELEMNPITYLTNIIEYRLQTLNLNSSFAGLYTSHVKITDKYNNRQIFISPDGFAAAAINLSDSNYEIWYPPAGFARGRMYVDDVHIKFTDGDLDLLADNGINQIRFAPGKGVAIWGQLTQALVPSAFDRINVRLLLNTLKPAITAFLETFLFELNTGAVKDSVRVTIENYLLGIHSRNGISDFKVVCDDTNNSENDAVNNKLNVDVYIKPVYSIEFINFTTILSNSEVKFNV